MVSLKSFLHYFSEPKHIAAVSISDAELHLIQRLAQAFGGAENIENVDACLTRLRVTVKDLASVDSQALQNEGALGVIILNQQVHAIYGKQSDTLRKLLDEHFAPRE